MNVISTIWKLIRLTRPLFLVGGIVLYCLGGLLAWWEGAAFNLRGLIIGQILVTSIQLLTHYANEYYDLEADRLNQNRTLFSGGSGVLASGEISIQVAQKIMIFLALVSVLALFATILEAPTVGYYGAIALFAAWSYSGPPLVMVSRGWGEVIASFVVALLVPVVGYGMQSGGQISPALLVVCLPLVLIHFSMLVAFQIPDREADEAAGKRTLAVRLGPQWAARLHNLSLFLAFCVILWLTYTQWPGAQWTWVGLPLAAWQSFYIERTVIHPPQRYVWLTLGAIALFALTSTVWLIGLAYEARRLLGW